MKIFISYFYFFERQVFATYWEAHRESGGQEIEFQEIKSFLIRRWKVLQNDQEIETYIFVIRSPEVQEIEAFFQEIKTF
jgi:hypothetical protein